MSSLAAVPVYYLDQDATWAPPARNVSREEARRLKMTGAGSFIEHGRAFRLHQATPPIPLDFKPAPLQTAITITFAEIEANVGIAASVQIVRKAQLKILAYPLTFDRLAVLARGSRIQPQIPLAVNA